MSDPSEASAKTDLDRHFNRQQDTPQEAEPPVDDNAISTQQSTLSQEGLNNNTTTPSRPGAQHCSPGSSIPAISPRRSIDSNAEGLAAQKREVLSRRKTAANGSTNNRRNNETSASAIATTDESTVEVNVWRGGSDSGSQGRTTLSIEEANYESNHCDSSPDIEVPPMTKMHIADENDVVFGLEAELVNTEDETKRIEAQVLEAMKNEAVRAEVVLTSMRKRRIIIAIATIIMTLITAAAILVGVFAFRSSADTEAAPTMSPTLPPEERISQMVAFLNNVTFSNSTHFKYPLDNDDDSTPEARALAWMIDDDPLRLTVDDDRDRFLQRYALACLWMSNPDTLLSNDWLRKESECEWEGVDCGIFGDVVGLTLPGKQLVKLPDDLGFLSHVRIFRLEINDIKGTIPSSIALMKDLTSFEIFDNKLTGMVPWESLSEMSNIEKFSIGLNKLSGTIPSAMANWWPNMTGFSVWSNSIEGTIPAELGSWSQLKYFLVGQTNVHGTLPASIGMWTNLIMFYAGKTSIHGTLPSTIAAWSALEEFNVHHSDLGGTIPEAIGDTWRNMAYLELNSNSFSGTLPSGMSQWSNIKTAVFQDNNFTGTMPLCDLDQDIGVLVSDCEVLNCTCCTSCSVTRSL